MKSNKVGICLVWYSAQSVVTIVPIWQAIWQAGDDYKCFFLIETKFRLCSLYGRKVSLLLNMNPKNSLFYYFQFGFCKLSFILVFLFFRGFFSIAYRKITHIEQQCREP